MPQSLSNILIHTIFSTKDRQPFLREQNVRADMHAYLGGVIRTLECDPIKIGGVSDHVHLLTTLSRTLTTADFVKEVKRVSSRWAKSVDNRLSEFQWQSGYAVFSVAQSESQKIASYIDRQEIHHRTVDFQDEYRSLLQEHNVSFDERYVWD